MITLRKKRRKAEIEIEKEREREDFLEAPRQWLRARAEWLSGGSSGTFEQPLGVGVRGVGRVER